MELKADMDNNNGAVASPRNSNRTSPRNSNRSRYSEEECAMLRVLNTRMMDLKYVHRQMHDISRFLSISDVLEEFSSECGYSLQEWMVCDAVIKNQPKKLPAKSFLEMYFTENNVTLKLFMQILLRMEDKQARILPLLHALWNAALYGNSQYFRDLYGDS